MKSHNRCAVCDSNEVSIVATTDRRGKPLQSVLCENCGLVWVDPRPDDDELKKFYGEDYRREYKGDLEPKMKHCYREIHRAIQRLERLAEYYSPGDKILDVGAGAGFFAYVLRENNADIDGIEPNKGYVKFAQDKLNLRTVKSGYLGECDKFNYYNIITINHVLEHLPNPLDSLNHMRNLLAKNGKIIIEVPNIEATYHSPNKVFHIAHLYWYNPITLTALLSKAGFKIIDLTLTKGTQHINVVAEKTDDVIPNVFDYKNASNIKARLASRSVLKHYLSLIPYTRFIKKIREYAHEKQYIQPYSNKIELIKSIAIPRLLPNKSI